MLATPVTVLTFASVTSAKTLSAQTGALQADEIAIYRVLLRHPEFSGRGLSLAPVVLLRDVRGEFGVILSAATLFNEWQSLSYQGTRDAFLRAARSTNSAMLPGEFEAGPGVTVVEPPRIVSCLGAPSDVAERQTFLFRVGFSSDRQQAITAISNCWTGRAVLFQRTSEGWHAVEALVTWTLPNRR
jgi:hypothetical protein